MHMELYHVLNRGVERRTIFVDDRDRARFVHDLYEFNDTAPTINNNRLSMIDLGGLSLGASSPERADSRTRLVDIHGWCIMGNHYHLLLSERMDGGLSKFLMKLNVGYAKYFNERYTRSGYVFQGRTKRIQIKRDAHFLHILHYIHLNPLDFRHDTSQWRSKEIANSKTALKHLNEYRWSSYLDYCGTPNFPSVLTRDLFGGVFKDYPRTLRAFLQDMELQSLAKITLE